MFCYHGNINTQTNLTVWIYLHYYPLIILNKIWIKIQKRNIHWVKEIISVSWCSLARANYNWKTKTPMWFLFKGLKCFSELIHPSLIDRESTSLHKLLFFYWAEFSCKKLTSPGMVEDLSGIIKHLHLSELKY